LRGFTRSPGAATGSIRPLLPVSCALASGIRIALLIAVAAAIENGRETGGSTQRLEASIFFGWLLVFSGITRLMLSVRVRRIVA
jgi:hypothetical protein